MDEKQSGTAGRKMERQAGERPAHLAQKASQQLPGGSSHAAGKPNIHLFRIAKPKSRPCAAHGECTCLCYVLPALPLKHVAHLRMVMKSTTQILQGQHRIHLRFRPTKGCWRRQHIFAIAAAGQRRRRLLCQSRRTISFVKSLEMCGRTASYKLQQQQQQQQPQQQLNVAKAAAANHVTRSTDQHSQRKSYILRNLTNLGRLRRNGVRPGHRG